MELLEMEAQMSSWSDDKLDHFGEVKVQFARVEARLDNIDGRLDGIDGRLDRFESSFDSGLARLQNIIIGSCATLLVTFVATQLG